MVDYRPPPSRDKTTAFGPPGDNLIDAAGVEIFNAGHHPTSLSAVLALAFMNLTVDSLEA